MIMYFLLKFLYLSNIIYGMKMNTKISINVKLELTDSWQYALDFRVSRLCLISRGDSGDDDGSDHGDDDDNGNVGDGNRGGGGDDNDYAADGDCDNDYDGGDDYDDCDEVGDGKNNDGDDKIWRREWLSSWL